MRRLYAAVAAAALAVPASALPPILVPPAALDTSNLATKSDVSTVAASVPFTCTGVPAPDTVGGTVGVGTSCVQRADAARATQVMPATAVTLSDGTFSGAWPGAFASTPTTAIAQAKTTTDPYTCQVGTWTTTTFAGKCWKNAQSITLPGLATSLLGLVLATAPAAPAGITVSVVGRQ